MRSTIFALTVILAAVLASGCASNDNPPSESTIEKAAATVELIGQTTAFFVVKNNPGYREQFVALSGVVESVAASGDISPDTLADAIDVFLDGRDLEPEVALGIANLSGIYRIWFAEYVIDAVDGNLIAVRCLHGLARGIASGAALVEPEGGAMLENSTVKRA